MTPNIPSYQTSGHSCGYLAYTIYQASVQLLLSGLYNPGGGAAKQGDPRKAPQAMVTLPLISSSCIQATAATYNQLHHFPAARDAAFAHALDLQPQHTCRGCILPIGHIHRGTPTRPCQLAHVQQPLCQQQRYCPAAASAMPSQCEKTMPRCQPGCPRPCSADCPRLLHPSATRCCCQLRHKLLLMTTTTVPP